MRPINSFILQSVFLLSFASLAYQVYQRTPDTLLHDLPHSILRFFSISTMSGLKAGDAFPQGVDFT